MIQTNLKKLLGRTDKSQAAIAKAVGVATSRFSDVVNGRAFLEDDEFKTLCETLSVKPTDIYSEEVAEIVYGTKPDKKTVVKSVQVRVSPENIAYLDRLYEMGLYDSRCEALNGILNAKRRQGNGWNDCEDE